MRKLIAKIVCCFRGHYWTVEKEHLVCTRCKKTYNAPAPMPSPSGGMTGAIVVISGRAYLTNNLSDENPEWRIIK